MQLAPRMGDDVVWFDLRKVRALRPKQRFTQMPVIDGLKLGVILPNEAREDSGLDPIDGLDDIDLTPVVPQTPPAPPPPAELPAAPASDDDDEVERLAPAAETREADAEAVELRRARIWRASDAVVTALEARWARSWRRLFGKQQEATLSRLMGKRGRQALKAAGERAEPAPALDPAHIFDVAFWTAAAVEVAGDLFEETAVAGLTRLAAQFGVSFDLEAPWVAEFIEQRVQDLAGQVTQTTYDAIRGELVDGVSAGESVDDLAARVRRVFTQASETRATTIARTEVISAYNGAATFGAAQMPGDVVAGYEWIATRDGRTRETHASADGQVIGRGEVFNVGGHLGAYPGDPALPADETIQCRCTIAFLTPDEYAEIQGRSRRRVEVRTATALLRLVDRETDLLAWRRALEGAAA